MRPTMDRWESVAIGAFIAAMVVSAVFAVVHGWTPVSDEALIELRVRDVPGNLPLVGVWSRFGWNHPGPALFYYLSPFYWATGGRSVGLLVAMITFHTLCVVGAWALVRRIDRRSAIALLIAGQVLLVTSEPWAVRNPWNPYVAIVGGLAMFAVARSCAERRGPGVALLLPVGSVLVQAHAVMAPMVSVVVAFALVAMSSCRERRVPWRAVVIGALTTFVVWIPPIVDQVVNRPGNLRSMLGSRSPGDALGVLDTIKVAFAQMALLPGAVVPEVVRQRFLPLQTWSFPLWAVVFIVALVLVVRSRDAVRARGMFITVGLLVGAYGGTVVLTDGAYSYLAIGTRVSVVVMIAMSAVVLLGALPAVDRRRTGSVVGLLSLALTVVLVISQVSVRNPLTPYESVVRRFADAIVADDPPTVIEVESTPPSLYTMIMAPGLVLALEKMGYEVRSPMLGGSLVGAHRVGQGATYVAKVTVPGHVEGLVAEGWTELAVHQPFTEDELAEIDRLNIEMLDHPPERTGSVSSGERPRLESELARIEQGRPSVALVVRRIR